MIRLKPKSVFGRAFLVLVVSGLAIQGGMFAAVMGLMPRPRATSEFRTSLDRYVTYLAMDIARDPTEENARRALDGTGFSARASGAVTWRTDEAPSSDSRRNIATIPFGDGKLTIEDGRPLFEVPVTTPRGDVRLTFLGPIGPPMSDPRVQLFLFAAILAAVFAVASFAIRRILRPLVVLSVAFDRMKHGQTDIKVPATVDDELGRLSRGFNEMAAGLRFLIKDKEQLFTEMSHEFRAPIARASAANALVEDDELRDAIESDLAELDSLIHAMLTAARLEAGSQASLQRVDLAQLLEGTPALFPQSSDRVTVLPPARPVACKGDPRSLRTLVRNLVENALKYSPSDKPVRVFAGVDGHSAYFAVRDEGVGIPEADVSRIFEPFYRGDDARKVTQPGFGLGLALCRRIARAHGGELRVESTPGQGTTVTAVFPLSERGD